MLELILVAASMPLWGNAAPLVRDVIAVGGIYVAVSIVMNLIPTALIRDEQGRVVLGRDGWTARHCFAQARAGVPIQGKARRTATAPRSMQRRQMSPDPTRAHAQLQLALEPVNKDRAPEAGRPLDRIMAQLEAANLSKPD
jgi:hypothetical protein